MKIVYKESFVQRLERQLKYIALDNPAAAKKFRKDLIEKIKKIPTNPLLNRKSIYFEDDRIRDLVFKGYTIVYRIAKERIEIFGFVKYQKDPTE